MANELLSPLPAPTADDLALVAWAEIGKTDPVVWNITAQKYMLLSDADYYAVYKEVQHDEDTGSLMSSGVLKIKAKLKEHNEQ